VKEPFVDKISLLSGVASQRKRQFSFSFFRLPVYFRNWRFVHRKNCDDGRRAKKASDNAAQANAMFR
jgi:hypothetical protein